MMLADNNNNNQSALKILYSMVDMNVMDPTLRRSLEQLSAEEIMRLADYFEEEINRAVKSAIRKSGR
jgi:hypothetical protein